MASLRVKFFWNPSDNINRLSKLSHILFFLDELQSYDFDFQDIINKFYFFSDNKKYNYNNLDIVAFYKYMKIMKVV